VSEWPAVKARRALDALQRIGWVIVRTRGSHRRLARPGWRQITFAFHDSAELGSAALRRIARDSGLKPEDL
jgi:predicted RNA binding protein YcfA (HicA-like mRNA interferase family)